MDEGQRRSFQVNKFYLFIFINKFYFSASKMTTVDLIRLPVEYKPIPIRHFIFFGRAYPELQGHETTSGAITPISQKILDKQNSHFDLKNLYGIEKESQKIIRSRVIKLSENRL